MRGNKERLKEKPQPTWMLLASSILKKTEISYVFKRRKKYIRYIPSDSFFFFLDQTFFPFTTYSY